MATLSQNIILMDWLLQDCRQRLCTVSELVTGQTGILDNCQVIVVYESRRKSRGFGAAAQRIAHSWKARKSTRSLILGLINYICLPQVVSRSAYLSYCPFAWYWSAVPSLTLLNMIVQVPGHHKHLG